MPTQRPTVKQQQVLDFIGAYIAKNKFSPTFREIGNHVGLKVGGIQNHLKALEARKKLTWNASESRSLKLTGAK